MKYSFLSIILSTLLLSVVSCNENSTIGNNLSDETITIVVDSNFVATGQSIANPIVQSRTISQLIGDIDAEGFGVIHSDFVAQFMPSSTIDTAGITAENIDSVKLFLQMERDAFIGDSLVPMGIEVYSLTKDLPYPIYSDFDATGYYEQAPFASKTYIASTINEPDSIKELENIVVSIPMSVEFGRDLYREYKKNPEVFRDPDAFTRDVFKGLYIRSSYGSGRISDFTVNSIRLFYHKTTYNEDTQRDTTIRYVGDYLAVTPEVIANNTIKYEPSEDLKAMIAAGDQVIAAPAGYEVDINFPATEIINKYNEYKNDLRVLNTLTFEIPADSIANKYGIAPPPYVLLVLKNKKDEFFANNQVNDNITSFYAEYNSYNNCYSFSMRSYLVHLLEKGEITPEDYTFTLTPVQVELEYSSGSGYYGSYNYVVSRIVPYVSKPAMTKISLKDAKILVTFSTGTGKF